jgi:hypothetical protein
MTLDNMIDEFLEDRRQSHRGGWAKITPEDVSLLRDIVAKLITLKCEKDADGGHPIEVHLVNRRTHERMHYSPVPYREQQKDDGTVELIPFQAMLRVLSGHVQVAASRLNTEVECARFYGE